jgi:lipopolysaccharide transport system ATP-binding protein
LIVDEVLAVGDLAFQQRCMSKMQDISQNEGQAILLVSHNLAAIRRLCSRVMVIDRGEIQFLGCPETACRSYLEKNFPLQSTRRWDDLDAPGDGVVSLVSLGCLNSEGVPTEGVDVTDPVRVAMQFRVHTGGHILVPNFHFYTLEGSCLFVVQDLDPEWRGRVRNPGLYTCEAFIPGNFLSEGGIVIGVAVTTMQPFHVHFVLQEAIRLEVGDRGSHDSARGDFTGDLPGAVRPLLKTQTRFTADSKPAGEHGSGMDQHGVLPEEL